MIAEFGIKDPRLPGLLALFRGRLRYAVRLPDEPTSLPGPPLTPALVPEVLPAATPAQNLPQAPIQAPIGVSMPAPRRTHSVIAGFGKLLSVLLGIGFVLFVLYLGYRYALPHWVAILFYSYVLGMAVFLLLFVAGYVAERNSASVIQQLREILQDATREPGIKGLVTVLREWVSNIAGGVSTLVVWPAAAVVGIRMNLKSHGKMLSMEEAALQTTGTTMMSVSLYSVGVVLAVLGLGYRGLELHTYGAWILGLLIVSTTLRHLGFIAAPIPLATRLRRVSSSPYPIFLAMFVADFSVLAIALTVFALHRPIAQIGMADYLGTANHLWHGWEAPLALFKEHHLSEFQILLAIPAVFLDLAFLDILRNFKDFRHGEEDDIWRAGVAARLGRFATALHHLKNVKNLNKEGKQAEIAALIGVNDLASARQKARELILSEHMEDSEDQVFDLLWTVSAAQPTPMRVRLAMLKSAMEAGVTDAFVGSSLPVLDWGDALPSLRELVAAHLDHYPITNHWVSVLQGDWDEALHSLEHASLEKPVDQIACLTLKMKVLVNEPGTTIEENSKAFRDYAAAAVPKMRELATLCKTDLERVSVLSNINIFIGEALRLHPESVEELKYFFDSVKSAIKTEHVFAVVRALERTAHAASAG